MSVLGIIGTGRRLLIRVSGPPPAPWGLTASATAANRIDLAWEVRGPGDPGASVERSPDGTTGWAVIATTGPNASAYSDTGLPGLTTFFYRVRTNSASGPGAASNTASATTLAGGTVVNGLTIPAARPRLWWTPDRLARAKAWYAAHPFTPAALTANVSGSGRDAADWALHYRLTGATASARTAIDWLLGYTAPQAAVGNNAQAASNDYLACWFYPVVFDWCYDQMASTEISNLVARFDSWAAWFAMRSWGGVWMPNNDYFWGYWTNEILWGVTSYGLSAQAPWLLDFALKTSGTTVDDQGTAIDSRLTAVLKAMSSPTQPALVSDRIINPTAYTPGLNYTKALRPMSGGVPVEGVLYGQASSATPVPAFRTAQALGLDFYGSGVPALRDYYKQYLCYLLYTTSQEPTHNRNAAVSPSYQLHPFGDVDSPSDFPYYPAVYRTVDSPVDNTLDFMNTAADVFGGTKLGQYAQTWLTMLAGVNVPHRFVAAVAQTGTASPLSELPLDYYGGDTTGFFWAKDRWGAGATDVFFQGRAVSSGHFQYDAGNFHVRSKGYYLVKESSGWQTTRSFTGTPANYNSMTSLAHNTVLFGYGTDFRGSVLLYDSGTFLTQDRGVTLGLESRADHAYAAVDFSHAYQVLPGQASAYAAYDNPYAQTFVREFLFVRPLATLVVMDRLESRDAPSKGATAAGVVKRFMLHVPTQGLPSATGNSFTAAVGTQALRVTCLLPASASWVFTDEALNQTDGSTTAFGTETDPRYFNVSAQVDDTGAAQSYFLTVLQARDGSAADVTVSLTDNGTSWTLDVTHPTLGAARALFPKGMSPAGGSFGYDASGATPAVSPLPTAVQPCAVTDGGPVWG